MTRLRRALVGAIVALALGGALWIDRDRPSAVAAGFPAAPADVMAIAAPERALSSTWYCPGIPAPKDGKATGKVTVLNPTSVELTAQLTLYPSDGSAPVGQSLALKPGAKEVSFVAGTPRADFVGAVVEVQAGSVVVTQTVITPAGQTVSPCASSASADWYFAAGTTATDACYTLVAFNPFPDTAVYDLRLVADGEQRTVSGAVLPARSVRTIAVHNTVRRNAQISVSATTRAGRFVLGRVQERGGCGAPTGIVTAGVAAPSVGEDWWFGRVEKKDNWSDRIVVFNPSDRDADVDVEIRPTSPDAAEVDQPVQRTLSSRSFFVLDPASEEGLPAGSYSVHVQTLNGVGVVAERVTDRKAAPNQPVGGANMLGVRLAAPRWTVTAAVTTPGSVEEISLLNPTSDSVTAKFKLVGPGGPTDLPGAPPTTIAPGGVVTIPVHQIIQLDSVSLIVESSGPIVVEQLLASDKPGLSRLPGIPMP